MDKNKEKEVSYDIRIYRVMPQDFDVFSIFDPLDRLDLAALPGTVVLGAVDMSDKNNPEPVGLMIAIEQGGQYVLEWLAVAPYYRNQEVGSEFIDVMFTTSSQAGFATVSALCTKEVPNSGAAYLKMGYFDRSTDGGCAYRLKISDYISMDTLPQLPEDSAVVSLRQLGASEREALVEYVKKAKLHYSISDRPLLLQNADEDLSSVWL